MQPCTWKFMMIFSSINSSYERIFMFKLSIPDLGIFITSFIDFNCNFYCVGVTILRRLILTNHYCKPRGEKSCSAIWLYLNIEFVEALLGACSGKMLKILLFSHFLSRSCSLSPSHSFRSFSFKQPWTAAECIFLIDFFPHSYCSPRFMYMFVAFSAHSNQGFSFYFFFFRWQFCSVWLSFIADYCKHCTFPLSNDFLSPAPLFFSLHFKWILWLLYHHSPRYQFRKCEKHFSWSQADRFYYFLGNFSTVYAARELSVT